MIKADDACLQFYSIMSIWWKHEDDPMRRADRTVTPPGGDVNIRFTQLVDLMTPNDGIHWLKSLTSQLLDVTLESSHPHSYHI